MKVTRALRHLCLFSIILFSFSCDAQGEDALFGDWVLDGEDVISKSQGGIQLADDPTNPLLVELLNLAGDMEWDLSIFQDGTFKIRKGDSRYNGNWCFNDGIITFRNMNGDDDMESGVVIGDEIVFSSGPIVWVLTRKE